MASTVGMPSRVVCIQPSGGATCEEPARCRARGTSRSGLGPGCGRRNTLRMASSPKIMLVLLCSVVSTRLSSPVSMTASGSAAKLSWPIVSWPAMACSSRRVSCGSCSAS